MNILSLFLWSLPLIKLRKDIASVGVLLVTEVKLNSVVRVVRYFTKEILNCS